MTKYQLKTTKEIYEYLRSELVGSKNFGSTVHILKTKNGIEDRWSDDLFRRLFVKL